MIVTNPDTGKTARFVRLSDLIIGRWAVCAKGILGKIERIEHPLYHGRTLWGTPWQSNQPKLIDEASARYLDMQLEFGEEAMRKVIEQGRAQRELTAVAEAQVEADATVAATE